MRDLKFKQIARWSPAAVLCIAALAMLAHGPIEQFAGYHDFADDREWLGIANAADVLSNAPFAIVGLWGLAGARHRTAYRLFFASLVLIAAGSAFYHLDPGDGRLLWDRLPIALACAGLLYGVRRDTHGARQSPLLLPALALAALASVSWWALTADLRPYLFLQAAPLVVIPLWQWLHPTPGSERIAFAVAILFYVAAKFAELDDGGIFDALGFVSGHTLKHLLAATASAVIVGELTRNRPVA